MAAKIPIAKGMEVDRRLGTLGGDVQSLITIVKEAFDDFQRKRKDRELNNRQYE